MLTLVSLMLRQIPLTWFRLPKLLLQVQLASNYWQYSFKKVSTLNYQPYFLFLFPPSANCDLDAGIENAGLQLPDYAPTSTSSEDSYLLAKRWLQNCQKEHVCGRISTPSKLPTRVIDVGSPDGSHLPFLHISSDADKNVSYLALSHCWGGAKILKLLTSNIGSLQKAIPMQELPLTFQHAIAITRKLGYQYLWIDSLCIIQDSEEDWNVESLDMKRVYQRSALTIGAAWGADSHAGCFVTRQPLAHFPCRIDQLSTGFLMTSYDRDMPGKSLPHASTGAPLFDRCWVLQERMLSRRTLYYGPKGLHWECIECFANEIYRQGRSSATDPRDNNVLSRMGIHTDASDHRFKLYMLVLRAMTAPIDVFEETTYIRHFYRVWNNLLKSYTKMKLSFPSDILKALSGLISWIEQSTGLTNVSGQWKELLPFDLLWRNASPDHCSKAPVYASWSWASMRGMRWGIDCGLFDHDILSRPFRLHTHFISYGYESILPIEARNRSSVRETGTLVLRGPLLKDILIPNDPNHPSLESDPGPPLKQRLLSGRLPKDFLWPDIVLEDSMEIYYLVVLSFVSEPSPLFPSCQIYAGLLLRRKSDDVDTFERIGYLEKWYPMNRPDKLANLLEDAVRTIRLV